MAAHWAIMAFCFYLDCRRRRSDWLSLPSFMDRHLLLMEICINGSPLQVGTVHLESMKSSAAMRSRQLSTIFSTLKESPNVVIMGDFNFCASWPEEKRPD